VQGLLAVEDLEVAADDLDRPDNHPHVGLDHAGPVDRVEAEVLGPPWRSAPSTRGRPTGRRGLRASGTLDSSAFRIWAATASWTCSTEVRAANEVHSASMRSTALAGEPHAGSLRLGTRPYQAASAPSAPAEVPDRETTSKGRAWPSDSIRPAVLRISLRTPR
jgi:hypothetical protein